MTHGEQGAVPTRKIPLPSHIFLADGSAMIRRKKPVCIDMPVPKTSHEEMYATLLMFQPWTNEVDDLGEAATSEEKCREMFETKREACTLTKEELRGMLCFSWLR